MHNSNTFCNHLNNKMSFSFPETIPPTSARPARQPDRQPAVWPWPDGCSANSPYDRQLHATNRSPEHI